MSKRVIFQNFVEHHQASVSEDEHEDEVLEEKEEKHEDHLEILRRSARKEQVIEQRRQRRRKKAHGSALWRYLNIRVQLRLLLSSTRRVVTLFLGSFILIGIWSFLVFGRPDSPSFWSDIDTRWGGTMSDNTSSLCEIPKPHAFTRQAAGGFASVAYAIVGWFMIFMWFLDERYSHTFEARFGNLSASLVVRRTYWSLLLGVSMIHLSVVAWLRHATFSNVGKRLETTGFWTVLFAFSVCSLTRMIDPPRKLRTREWTTISKTISFIAIFATTAIDVAFGIRIEALRHPGVPEVVFGALAGLAILAALLHWRMHRVTIESEVWLLFIGIFIFIGGFLLAHFDNNLCNVPGSFLQPYAFWHVSNSIAAMFFYLFLRSDLWVTGDGAEFAPRITPFLWIRAAFLWVLGYVREICKGVQLTEKGFQKKSQRITLLRQKPPAATGIVEVEPTGLNDGGDEDEEQQRNNHNTTPTKRLATSRSAKSVKSLVTMWTPELGFSAKQIRIAEFTCGILITGFVIFVIYLALARPTL